MSDHPMNRREFLGLTGKAMLGGAAAMTLPRDFLAATPQAPGDAKEKPPNFVIVFTDDQGYQDLGCFGSPDIKTPRVDKMAAEGTKFTDFYVAAPVCTPSRAALLTGCYPMRVSLPAVLNPRSLVGISDKEITLAQLLKTRGYATACVGKWHLGHLPPFLPTRHGFDSYFGIPYSNDMPTPTKDGRSGAILMRNEEVVEHPVDQTTLTERYTQEAIKFITAGKDKPFFLYLAHNMPHVPLHVSEKFKGKSSRGLYGDVIECIDWSTGQVLDAIKDLGLDDNTCVIYTSDNGPWLVKGKDAGAALPLRDGKGTVYEGGMREPCVMRWPGKIPAGKVCSEMALTMDVFPTLGKLAGAKIPDDRIIDGQDIWPLMSGRPGAKTPHEAFFFYNGPRLQAVRSGKWKYHRERTVAAASRPARKVPPALYDLEAEIGEKTDLSEKNPDVCKRLEDLCIKFNEDLMKNARPCGKVAPTTTQATKS
jgi:arylsulfatase A-like enzyme